MSLQNILRPNYAPMTEPITDETRFSLTDAGADALLRAELPTLHDAARALVRSGNTPAAIARHVAASGASDNLARLIHDAARHMTETRSY